MKKWPGGLGPIEPMPWVTDRRQKSTKNHQEVSVFSEGFLKVACVLLWSEQLQTSIREMLYHLVILRALGVRRGL